LAVPLGLASLSVLSGLSPSEAQRRLQRVVPPILIATVPVSAFLALHSQQVIQVLYQRGAFDAGSSALTQGILFGLALGFWAQIAGYVLMKALSAQLRNGEVLRFMALALGLNMAANLSLYQALGPMALGLSSSLYGLTLFVLSVRAIGIGATLLPPLAWLGLGTLLYVPFGLGLAREGWVGLLSGAAVCALFWLLYIPLVPVLRAYLVPLVTHLQRRTA
jgi:putative peptidoglycan lipid II flippase